MVFNMNKVAVVEKRELSIKEDLLCLNDAFNWASLLPFLISAIFAALTAFSMNDLREFETNLFFGFTTFFLLYGAFVVVSLFREAKAWLLFDKDVASSLAKKELVNLGLAVDDNNVFVVMDGSRPLDYQCDVYAITDEKYVLNISFSSSYEMKKKFMTVDELIKSMSDRVTDESICMLDKLSSNRHKFI